MFRDRLRQTDPRVLFGGVLATLVVVSFFIQSVTDAIQNQALRDRYGRVAKVLDEERDENRKVRAELLEGQEFLRLRYGDLSSQFRAVVAFIEQQGISLPPELRYEVRTESSGDDDDEGSDSDRDDEDDPSPPRSTPPKAPTPTRPSPSQSGDAPNLIEDLTEDTQERVEDLTENLPEMVPEIPLR